MDLGNFIVNPLSLSLVILGVVEFIKKFGISGRKLMLVSMAVGLLLGVLYQLRALYPSAQAFIDLAFFAIATGLGASGIYSFVDDRFPGLDSLVRKLKNSGVLDEELPR